MATYTITLNEAEDKALSVIALSQQEWIENAVKSRCKSAIDEIASAEIERKLEAGEPINGSKEDIVMAADVKTAAVRQQEAELEMAAQAAETGADSSE